MIHEMAEEKLSEIWSPDPEIQNEVEQRKTESVELILLPDGTVQYEERFGATLNAQLDLGRFPFDTQAFDLNLQSFLWDQGDCLFVIDEAQTGFDRGFEIPEWTVTGAEALLDVRSAIRDDRAFSTFSSRIHARRNARHYVLRFMMPLFFVMGPTWAAFWMPVEHRFRVRFIALLTVVASHTVIARELPRLHYPTFADVLLIICYVFASALIVVSIRVQHLMDSNREERVAALDRRTRVVDTCFRPAPARSSIVLVLASLCLAAAGAHAGDSEKEEEGTVVEAGSQVGIEYTLTLEDGTKVDSNVGGEALRFEQGAGRMIPGLDKALVGMGVGEAKQVTVSPEEGYGPVNPDAFGEVPLGELPEDAREPGTTLMAQDEEGRVQQLRVHKVEGDQATLDFNHPLAGKTLIFDVKILEIR